MTPPFPSPPTGARSSRMRTATFTSPTGARITLDPAPPAPPSGPNHPRPGTLGHAVEDQPRGQIRNDRPLTVSQNDTSGERQGVVLADRLPLFGDQGQSVDVRIDGHPDVGPTLKHEPFQ